MLTTHDRKRRAVVAAIAALPLGDVLGKDGGSDTVRMSSSRVLVAYFSRSGNMRVVAGLLQRAFKADVFEIHPVIRYPEEYLATVEQARHERDSGHERALEARDPNMGDFDKVFLGFPIWGETTPPVIRAFLSAHDLSDRNLIPFVTHEAYGLGNSQSVLASHALRANLLSPFVMEADQERRTMNFVNERLNETGLTRVSATS